MKKDIFKAAEEGSSIISNRRDLLSSELEILFKMSKEGLDGLWKALSAAYYSGFYQGYAQRRTEERK